MNTYERIAQLLPVGVSDCVRNCQLLYEQSHREAPAVVQELQPPHTFVNT